MNRGDLVRLMVLNEISNDYENVDQIIFPNVAQDGAKLGLTLERSEIVDALAGLIEEGLAKAYLLSAREPFSTELQGMPVINLVEEDFKIYFYITKKGLDLQLSNDIEWPFDDEHEPLPNWHLDRPEP